MASCSISRYILSLFIFLFPFLLFRIATTASASEQFASFAFQTFGNSSNFESQIALSGDANRNGSFLQITGSWKSSSGRLIYKKPIKLAEGKDPRKRFSFSTFFSFSISPEEESGDGLAFVMLPDGFSHKSYFDGNSFGLSYELGEKKAAAAFAVEFDTKLDPNYGDSNANHVGVDVGSLVSVKTSNVSKAKLVLNSGDKLQCWIDYEASSKRLEVRLTRFGHGRPTDPLLSFPVDLAEMFKDKQVYFGLCSSNSNSTQKTRLFSWSFKLRPVPYWMHSQPLDPESVTKDAQPLIATTTAAAAMAMHKKSECVLRVVTALIVGTACGALGALIVLLVWTMFTGTRPVVPEEFVEYDCDKVKVLVADKASLMEEDQAKARKK